MARTPIPHPRRGVPRRDSPRAGSGPLLPCVLAVLGLLCLTLPISGGCREEQVREEGYLALRERMVTEQIAARGIGDEKILQALRRVPRHEFVPEPLRDRAYADRPLPIGEGQTISQPYIVALMTLAVAPDKNMKVLEIGTGSGYQAAVLAELCRSVYTIEIVETLGKRAAEVLAKRYSNVHVRIGDGYRGWPEEAPFDAIIVTASPTSVPAPLIEQLREGGRMVIPVGEANPQELVLLTKKEGRLRQESILPVRFVPMVDPRGKTY
jgi:protein-L-isoaspartate(D-aspartate) O-methyltransferase